MKNILIFCVVVFAVFIAVSATGKSCYDFDCPEHTTGCKLHKKSSEDGRTLVKTISCLDRSNGVLNQHVSQIANPYGQFITYESTSYSNSYTKRVVYTGSIPPVSSGSSDDVVNNVISNIDVINNGNKDDGYEEVEALE